MHKATSHGRRADSSSPAGPVERYRVEGLAKRGRILYAHISGRAGRWRVTSTHGFCMEVYASTVEEALKKVGRRLPFRPVAIRSVEGKKLNPDF